MTCNNEGRPVPAGTAPSNNHHRDHAGNEADGQATEPRHCPVAAATKPKPPPPRDSEAGLEDSMSEGRGMGGGRFKRPQAPPIQTLPPQPPQAAPLPSPKIPTNGHSRSIKQEYLPAPTEAAGHAPDEYEIQLPEIVDVANFMATPIPEPTQLIEGVLHQGAKLVVGGGSKSFKTWTLLALALAIAYGLRWLGIRCSRAKVLYCNFELSAFSIQRRLEALAKALNITLEAGWLEVWNLRGHSAGHDKLLPAIAKHLADKGHGLVILDPIYKLYGDGTDENSARDVAGLMRSIEGLSVDTGAAVAYGAHFAKGAASQKAAIDRISGSGVFARDPDSLIALTPHTVEGCFTADFILRDFPSVESFVVRWDFPLMQKADNLDPQDLKQPPRGRKKVHTPERLLKLLGSDHLTSSDWQTRAEGMGMSRTIFYELVKVLKNNGAVTTDASDQYYATETKKVAP